MKLSQSIVAVDTSVLINLNATGYGSEILKAYPNRVVVAQAVEKELEAGRARGRKDYERLQELKSAGLIDIRVLEADGERVFEQLVAGPAAQTLDDGEAATIACSADGNLIVAVDDQKAMRICEEQFPELTVIPTVSILRDSAVIAALGADKMSRAVLGALQVGRMRVLRTDLSWVLAQISEDEARRCPSLRGHKLVDR